MIRKCSKTFSYNKFIKTLFFVGISPSLLILDAIQAAENTLIKNNEIEVIEVIGLRTSINSSIESKRNADRVMDTIFATDIGKLPDNNLAEAIQRVTGVQITRENGVGAKVSIRGMSPFFSRVTINGQSVTPPSNEDRVSGGFGLSMFNSSLSSQIQVIKSPTADMEEGGLGGTVNIITRRGFDFDKPTGNVQVGSTFEELADEQSANTSFFFANPVNNQFAFTINFSLFELVNRKDYVDINRWQLYDVGVENDAFAPFRSRIRHKEQNTETINLGSSIQYRPNKGIEFYTDITFSERTNDSIGRDLSFDFKDAKGNFSDITITKHPGSSFGTVTSFLTDYSKNGVALKLEEKFFDVKSSVLTITQGMNWTIDDIWLLEAAISYGKGDKTYITDATKIQIDKKTKMDFNDGKGKRFPIFGLDVRPDSEINSDADEAFGLMGDMNIFTQLNAWSWAESGQEGCYGKPIFCDITDGANDYEENTELSIQLDLNRTIEFGDIEEIKFGGRYRKRSRTLEVYRDTLLINGEEYNSRSNEARGLLTNIDDVSQGFYEAVGGKSPFYSSYPQLQDIVWYDGKAFVDIAKKHDLNRKGEVAGFDWRKTEEKVLGIYVMANAQGELGNYTYKANFGVRVVNTDIDGLGYGGLGGEEVSDINQLTSLKSSNQYWDVLPSVNISINITEKLIFRSAVAKVMTRPEPSEASYFAKGPANIDDLSYLIAEGDEITFRYGNPDLDPYRAWQFDMGLEFYAESGGLINIGLFHKDIESFIVEQNIVECNEMDKEGFLPVEVTNINGYCGISLLIDGNEESFKVTAQQGGNGDGASITGVEIGIQQSFTFLNGIWQNFGVQANYTYIDSSSELIEKSTGDDLPFEGVSENSYNVIGFYDDGIFQARVAYNYRSEYISVAYEASSLSSVSVEGRGQLDASISYNLTPDFVINLSGQNLTNESLREFQGEKIRLRSYQEFGARYMLNASYKF
jgi:iron complex outermembrane receptor protein